MQAPVLYRAGVCCDNGLGVVQEQRRVLQPNIRLIQAENRKVIFEQALNKAQSVKTI